MNFVKFILDLCFFQAKPQDLPADTRFVVATTIAAIATNVLTHREHDQMAQVVAMSTAQVIGFGFTIWLVLRIRQHTERFQQTITAIFGASALLQLAAWPVVGWLYRVKETPDASLPMMLLFTLSIWVLAIAVYVIKHALELGTGASILITLGCQLLTLMVVFILFGQIG